MERNKLGRADPDLPLLWFSSPRRRSRIDRNEIRLRVRALCCALPPSSWTKQAIRACITSVSDRAARPARLVTIEGLPSDRRPRRAEGRGGRSNVTACGFLPGRADHAGGRALLTEKSKNHSHDQIREAMGLATSADAVCLPQRIENAVHLASTGV